ncbi:hypothetical protein [Wolbachia endosymbiont (group A) of Ophion costatus]
MPANNFYIFHESTNQKENNECWIPVSKHWDDTTAGGKHNVRTVVCHALG